MPAGHLPSFAHFLPEGERPMELTEDLLVKSEIGLVELLPPKQEPLIDMNNNDDLLLPPNSHVELLQWDPHWTGEGEVTTLTNLMVDPIFLPFDQDSNKLDWEPSSSSDLPPFSPSDMWASSDDSLLRNALQPSKLLSMKEVPELRKVLSYPVQQVVLSDVALSQPSSTYYELLVEPDVVIPTHVEELSRQSTPTHIKTMEISTTTNNTLSAKWTYTTTNPDGTPKGRKRTKKPKPSSTTTTLISQTLEKPLILKEEKAESPGGSSRKERSLHYCSICSKGFKDKYSVNVHVRTHTGEKPFSCTLCGKSFRQKAHLAKHYQTHAAKANGHPKSHKHKTSITVLTGGAVIHSHTATTPTSSISTSSSSCSS